MGPEVWNRALEGAGYPAKWYFPPLFPVTIVFPMHRAWPISVLLLTVAAFCADPPNDATTLLPCAQGSPGTAPCQPSKKELKEAKKAFDRALKLQKTNHQQEAFDEFEKAARLAPQNVGYVTAREMARQQLVYHRLERGNDALLKNRPVEAMAEFRGALQLDEHNQFAQQRMNDALAEWTPRTHQSVEVLEDSGEVRVSPAPEPREFHIRGDSRQLLTQVAAAFGVTATFDDSVTSRPVRFDIDSVDFYTAMRAASDVTRTFWTPLDNKQILVASESVENHRRFDRMAMRNFYIPGTSSPQDLTDIVNLLRNLFEIRFITPQPQRSALVVRAPSLVLDAATRFLQGLDASRPQVMLDVKVYQISYTLTRNMGLHIPNNFQLFNIPAGALAALGGQNIQDLINQLIASGGINQANSQALSALLAQLQGQQNSIFSQPLTTFGNGLTLMGLSLGTAGVQLSINDSTVKTLEHATLRVSQGDETTFRMGTRYPILNASFAPIYNTPAIAQVIQNNTFQAAFPSFNYEDLGLSLKAKPVVNSGSSVSLHFEMQFRALGGQSLNGVPIISNREYQGSITLLDGEPAVVAGTVSRTEQRSMNGIPGMGLVPGLNKVMTTNSKQENDDELLLVITPHILTARAENKGTLVWMPN